MSDTTKKQTLYMRTRKEAYAEIKRLREAVTQYSEKDAWYVAEVKRLRSVIKDFESFLYFEGFNPKEVYDEGGEE